MSKEKAIPKAPGGLTMEEREDNRVVHATHAVRDFAMEDSPSYEILIRHNLLRDEYRVASVDDLDLKNPNSTRCWNSMTDIFCCPLVMCGCWKDFEVDNGLLKKGYDGKGNFIFFGPGVHQVLDPWYTIERDSYPYGKDNIFHGDRTILTVPQGSIGYCTERGQPVLLPPGLHQWQSSTLYFKEMIDLNEPVIELGPWTLLTIDQGYMAVTQDNGRQVILDGGAVHFLTHRNWKFEKIVSTKIQTDELKRNEAASADNVIMLVDATVLWRIANVETAVRWSAETMGASGVKSQSSDMMKLRNDVLKQAEASLAFFIGTINFSDTMAAAAIDRRSRGMPEAQTVPATPESPDDASSTPRKQPEIINLYDADKLRDAVAHANEITETYGVEIMAINIISAIPKDKELQASLAKGAVAAAEAQMLETTAKGKAQAMQIEAVAEAKRTMVVANAEAEKTAIEADAEANRTMVLAKADADADAVRAEGAKQAAELLSTNEVSVELAKIEKTGQALAGKASFFFGGDSKQMSSLLANPNVIHK